MDGLESVEISEEAVEKDRSSFGHADRPGVGDGEGEGDESSVVVGDAERVFFRAMKGL